MRKMVVLREIKKLNCRAASLPDRLQKETANKRPPGVRTNFKEESQKLPLLRFICISL